MGNPFSAAISAAASWFTRIGSSSKSLRSQVSSGLRYQMRQGQPGQWASDHRVESENFSGWNYIAIHAIAKLIMRSEVCVYQPDPSVIAPRNAEGLRDITTDETVPVSIDHDYLRLLNRPNPYQSGASFRYEQTVQLCLTGTAIAWKVRNAFGKTRERYVVPTAVCTPVDPCEQYPQGGFKVQPWGTFGNKDSAGFTETIGYKLAIGQIIDIRDCVIVRLPHPIVKGDGYSATAAVAAWIDTARNLDTSRWSQLNNGPDPSMLVEPPNDASFENQAVLDAYERSLNRKYGGPANHGKIMVATHGKATPLSTTPKEMAYETGFTQLGDAILAAHGTSKAAIGMVDGMTYGGIAAGIRAWVQLTCQPLASLLAEEDQEQQSPEFGDDLKVEYNCPTIDDPELIEQQIVTDVAAGIITKGELRLKRGMELFGDSRDDELAGSEPGTVTTTTVDTGLAGTGLAGSTSSVDEGAVKAADTALNGAQVDSLLSIVEQVTAGTLPLNSARAVIGAAFPAIASQTIDSILAPLQTATTAASAVVGGTGEFSDISRQQLIRNRKAIDDVLNLLQAGTWNDARARTELQMIGLAPQTIDGLLSQPNDQAEIDAAAGEVSEATKTLSAYGYCPQCGARGVRRERRINGNDQCANGHEYPSRTAVTTPPSSSAKTVREHACVLAILSPGLAEDVLNVARTIPQSSLAGDGMETEPHVTIKWGLLPVSPRKVAKLLQSLEPLDFTVGRIGFFADDGTRGSDVVFLEVTSEDADYAHEILSENLSHEEAKREYRPHITLAYVKPGQGEKFSGESSLTGQVFTISQLVFSGTMGARTIIPLGNRDIAGESLYANILDRMRTPAPVGGNGNGH